MWGNICHGEGSGDGVLEYSEQKDESMENMTSLMVTGLEEHSLRLVEATRQETLSASGVQKKNLWMMHEHYL